MECKQQAPSFPAHTMPNEVISYFHFNCNLKVFIEKKMKENVTEEK